MPKKTSGAKKWKELDLKWRDMEEAQSLKAYADAMRSYEDTLRTWDKHLQSWEDELGEREDLLDVHEYRARKTKAFAKASVKAPAKSSKKKKVTADVQWLEGLYKLRDRRKGKYE